jgi:hypothetical protein
LVIISEKNMLTEKELTELGFDKQDDNHRFAKSIGGRVIYCYQPSNNAGYWVCDIWTTHDPVQKNRIASKKDLEEFINMTCSKDIVRDVIIPNGNKQ